MKAIKEGKYVVIIKEEDGIVAYLVHQGRMSVIPEEDKQKVEAALSDLSERCKLYDIDNVIFVWAGTTSATVKIRPK